MENNITIEKKSVNILMIVLVIALITTVAVAVIILKLFLSSQKKLKSLESSASSQTTPTKEEIDKVISQVSRHIVLPRETPQIITVTNVETLKKDQPFFSRAQNGHKLLVYQNKVIIFDPLEDKIVDIAYIKPTEVPLTPTPEITFTPASSPSATSILSPTNP